MRLSRLRSGELLAVAGAIVLLVAPFLRWYDAPGAPHETGIRAVGWLALLPLALTVIAGLALAAATAGERTPALPLAIGVLTVPVALIAVVVVAVRLLAEPGPDAEVSVRWPAYLGLAGTLAVLAGAWRALADERTDTPEAIAQTERVLSVRGTPRAVPPPRDGRS